MKFKKGDTIWVTAGKDKGKKGKITSVLSGSGEAIVAGINIAKRHVKRRDEKNPGGIVDIAKPLSFCKIALLCASCGKITRAGFLITGKDKVRVCRKCGQKL